MTPWFIIKQCRKKYHHHEKSNDSPIQEAYRKKKILGKGYFQSLSLFLNNDQLVR